MEKDLAIMIADLSGYTALTEVHGATSAADLVEHFLAIVNDSLTGSSILKERSGDEVLIIAESADDLLATAMVLHQKASSCHGFLQLHGGLHFGRLLQRGFGYFGSAINCAARIAAKAEAGTFFCSAEFRNAVTVDHEFESRGLHSFRNMEGQKELFKIITDDHQFLAVDPVCRMLLLSEKESCTHPGYAGQYFCSEICMKIYDEKRKLKEGSSVSTPGSAISY